ncbi:2-C-methyl-D-erythritol 4-phosphate cytidylyltransferase [Prochlorococcus marinus]|uniref:2-C-methyl-D-erythritol 4-phosphate cytidylyltransferase n=1 Tax=Prochlorococcus marinus XMU1408 TaxID=2213228 RepID=A0A318R9B5_PROMR|nr:2-C-methyl-D-erythritol 4-phosphate cytidylyltransferase [Prochlorococcus marinus]MBW3041481.1 2-C-methyl-D-erythritol 4-phosphate cytidylyltransferase [Prochlorococcus marinus str. XMU1408]PYE02639.1 2-C-methyl-D-erythritol 4-phosphate cytidylyltransferase [Prochlorococcus marinus XMU1408]
MHLLIAAAGSGRRMGADKNKLLLNIAGRTVLEWTLKAAFASKAISWIGIVGQPKDKNSIKSILSNSFKSVEWINGGSTRQQSVQLGLSALPDDAQSVLIHDGARCLVNPLIFDEIAEIVSNGQAVIAASQVTDTIKKVDQNGEIIDSPPRAGLWSAQTPQAFPVDKLKHAHSVAIAREWNVTDDASLFERLGIPVKIYDAGPSNIKVTTPFDLVIAESLLSTMKD